MFGILEPPIFHGQWKKQWFLWHIQIVCCFWVDLRKWVAATFLSFLKIDFIPLGSKKENTVCRVWFESMNCWMHCPTRASLKDSCIARASICTIGQFIFWHWDEIWFQRWCNEFKYVILPILNRFWTLKWSQTPIVIIALSKLFYQNRSPASRIHVQETVEMQNSRICQFYIQFI